MEKFINPKAMTCHTEAANAFAVRMATRPSYGKLTAEWIFAADLALAALPVQEPPHFRMLLRR